MRYHNQYFTALSDAWKGPATLGLLFLLLSLVFSAFLLLIGSIYLIDALPTAATYVCVVSLVIFSGPEENWNPSVRELYPMRQLRLERAVMLGLHRLGLPYRKSQRLPPEIWGIILEHVLYIPYATDVACHPITFHLLVRDQKYWGDSTVNSEIWGRDLKYSKERRYLPLRQVCRTWAHFIDLGVAVWIGGRGRWNEDPIPRRTQRLDFRVTPESYPNRSNINQMVFHHLATTPGGLASLRAVAIKDAADPVEFGNVLEETIFKNAPKMPSLESLIFTNTPPSAHLLGKMQSTFASIKSLTLRSSHVIHGSISLGHLEILIIDAQVSDDSRLWFPALVHCYLGRRYLHSTPYTDVLLPGPSTQIESLELHDGGVAVTTTFWLRHPSLRSLKITASLFKFVDAPPTNHPLEHVALGRLRGSRPENLLQGLVNTLACLPDLRSLSIPHVEPHTWETPEPPRPIWYFLFIQRHKRRGGLGMVWLDGQGAEITERLYWKQRSIKAWEGPVALLIYATWVINTMWLAVNYSVLSYTSMLATLVLWVLYHAWAVYDHYAA